MRFYEIASPQRKVVATTRFEKELAYYVKGYPGLMKTFREFLEYRMSAPASQGWGKKDSILTGGVYGGQGLWHVHLYHGKVIVIYKIDGDTIKLLTVVEHNYVEGGGKGPATVMHYINGLKPSDFHPYELPRKKQVAGGDEWDLDAWVDLSDDEFDAVKSVFYDLASHPQDRSIIEQTAQGKTVPELWELLRSLLSSQLDQDEADKAIVKKFGSPDAIKSFAGKVLRDTAAT